MDDLLMLPITHQGQELEFEVRVYQYGYIHRVEVQIGDIAFSLNSMRSNITARWLTRNKWNKARS
jgi:hypothetical protein